MAAFARLELRRRHVELVVVARTAAAAATIYDRSVIPPLLWGRRTSRGEPKAQRIGVQRVGRLHMQVPAATLTLAAAMAISIAGSGTSMHASVRVAPALVTPMPVVAR